MSERRDRQDALSRYNAMRDFRATDEPVGEVKHTRSAREFVVQKHDARALHYDLRLELDGVMRSWAVPKGPSLDPRDKRLAVEVEDHPLDYRSFEGTIPEGQYGGGPVIVWDRGTWRPEGDARTALERGHLDFSLEGEKLHGRFVLVRTAGRGKRPNWLLIKRSDEHVAQVDLTEERPESVLTRRTIEDVVAGVPSKTGAPMPDFGTVAPELATLVDRVPAEEGLLYEIKYDGYRTLGWLDGGKALLASRRGLDWTAKYPAIADALSHVRAKTAIFDGEVAYVLEDGRTSFQKLQNALGGASVQERSRLVYFVFDLLYLDGVDLREEPLRRRKDLLRTILAGEGPPLAMSDDVADGKAFFREACKLELEGIIGKRADAAYRSGRWKDWVKVKCHKRQELVIVGFTPPEGRREGIGALLLGVRDRRRGALRYAGKVGTGFSNATLADLARRLAPLETSAPELTGAPRIRTAHWVEPKLVAEVRFSEWTGDGALRHPSFLGLRADKRSEDVVREVAQPVAAAKSCSLR